MRTLCRRLLLTDFVTELRAAVHNAADGKTAHGDPVLLRAHLARLLRDIGCNDEARSEGEAVLAAFKTVSSGSESNCSPTIRRRSRSGRPPSRRRAMTARRRRSTVAGSSSSGNRRRTTSLRTPSRFRDWWVGRAYASACCERRRPERPSPTWTSIWASRPPRQQQGRRRAVGSFVPGVPPGRTGQTQARRTALVGPRRRPAAKDRAEVQQAPDSPTATAPNG